VAEAQGAGEMVKASEGMKAVNLVLDFCEDYNLEMAGDMNAIDDYVNSDPRTAYVEIMRDVFQPLFEAWLKPWLGIADESGDSKKKTSTKNPRSTKG
jgi:hypothetical protein